MEETEEEDKPSPNMINRFVKLKIIIPQEDTDSLSCKSFKDSVEHEELKINNN